MTLNLITVEEFLALFEELEAIKESITNLKSSLSKKWYKEAIEYSNASKSTILSYRRKELFEFSQNDNNIHYKLLDVDVFLESNYTGSKRHYAKRRWRYD